MVTLSGMVFQILHILESTMTTSPPFLNLPSLNFSWHLLYSNGLAIRPGFPDFTHIEVNHGCHFKFFE